MPKYAIRLISTSTVITALVPLIVLIGWILGNLSLTKFFNFSNPMNPVTAIELILIPIIILGVQLFERNQNPMLRKILLSLAYLVIAMASVKLFDYFGWNLNLDRLLFESRIEKLYPNSNQSPMTAIAVLLLGLGLVGRLEKIKFLNLTFWSAFICIEALHIVIIGYALNSPELISVFTGKPVALITAICLIVLGTIIIITRPRPILGELGFKKRTIDVVARYAVLYTTLVPLGSALIMKLFLDKNFLSQNVALGIAVMFQVYLAFFTLFSIRKRLNEEEEKLSQLQMDKDSALLKERASRAIGEVSYRWNPNSNELVWSDAYKDLFGYSQTVTTYDDWLSNIEKNQRKNINTELESVLKAGKTIYVLQYKYRDINGEYIEVEDRGFIEYDANKHPVMALGVVRDVSLTQKLLTQNKNQINQLENIIESITDQVVVINREWEIQFANKAASDYLHLASNEINGKFLKDFYDLVLINTRQENWGFLEDSMITKQTKICDPNCALKKNDEYTKAEVKSFPIMFEGNVFGAVLIIKTYRPEDSSDSKGENTSYVYAQHQMRTPITQALFTLENAIDAKTQAEAIPDIRKALTGLRSVERLIEKTLELIPIEERSIITRERDTDLAEVINQAVKKVTSIPEYSIAKFKVELEGQIKIKTDSNLLSRVLEELLENAIIYSAESYDLSIKVTKPDSFIRITITNTGKPILATEQTLIFTRYFRGSNKPANSVGAGLGLYIAKAYAEYIGGKIYFLSNDKETTFYVDLPLN